MFGTSSPQASQSRLPPEQLNSKIASVVEADLSALNIRKLSLDPSRVDWNRVIHDAAFRIPPFQTGKTEKGFRELNRSGAVLKGAFTEVQSGKDDDRPQLSEALKLCRLTNSTLRIAKLDRLSRNVAFLAALQQAGTKFVACDLPEANELVVHILAAVAQAERKAISERTKSALAAARARGVRLGNPRLGPGTAVSAAIARKARIVKTNVRAGELKEVIENAEREGHVTLRQLAHYLNEIGISSAYGKQWHANSVRRLRQRNSAIHRASAH
jgi:DNA invertase Pin-like site-specific DNA recombinase